MNTIYFSDPIVFEGFENLKLPCTNLQTQDPARGITSHPNGTDEDYNIGESTLETLPGTLTPPSAVYSPQSKLTDSCITQTSTSTSTPTKSNVNACIHPMMQLAQFLVSGKARVNTKIKDTKKVCFLINGDKGSPEPQRLTVSELKFRKKAHLKILKKRKKMWKNYQKAKMQKGTDKIKIKSERVRFKLKKNDGDLI